MRTFQSFSISKTFLIPPDSVRFNLYWFKTQSIFADIFAPLDGSVINGGIKIRL